MSYAIIAYQTAYLKSNYPVEFMTSVMNCDSGTVDRMSFLISEVKAMSIRVLPPDINKSLVNFTAHNGNEIRFGLSHIKGIGEEVIKKIVIEREIGNEFKNVSDFIRRVDHKSINKRTMEAMIKSGAFDSLESRSIMLKCLEQILIYGKLVNKELLPTLTLINTVKDIDINKKLVWEKELLGLFVSKHPMMLYKEVIKQNNRITEISDIKKVNSDYVNIGGIVNNIKKIITKKGKAMMFCNVEDESNKVDIVVFPTVFQKVKDILSENNIVTVSGKVENTENGTKIICLNAKLITSLA